jgi:CRP-like cAMP-binding protein
MRKSPAPLQGKLETLSSTALFQGLNPDSLASVVGAARTHSIEDGAFFFMEGDPAQKIYVLLVGKVKLSQVTPDGQQVILEFIGPAREFGVVAVLSQTAYPVSAQAVGDCQALTWERGVMNQLMGEMPVIARNALQLMARQIGEFQSRIKELSTQRVERRIARTLLRLAQQSGRKAEEGVLIDLPLTRQDLAEMAGTTLFTVSRTLKRWEARGLIRSKRERVIILFPHGLVSIAEDLNP